MPEYVCRVGAASGEVREESHVAPDEATLRGELARRDLHVFDVKPRARGLTLAGIRLGGGARRVGRRQFLLFNQELVTLLRAGLPLLQCLEVLLERMPPGPFQRYLTDIRERVQSGSSLSDAFLAQGEAFPKVYAASLTAGERSGELAGVMARYVAFVRKTENVRTKVTAALIYPAILSVLSVGLIGLLMFYILPKFSSFYGEFDAELPTITVIVMTVAGWLNSQKVVFAVALVASIVAVHVWVRTSAGELALHGGLLRIPLLGHVLRIFQVAQFCRTLSTLLAGGIPLVPALQTTHGALTNRVFTRAVDSLAEQVKEGKPLWESIESTRVMTDMTIEMVKVGEATGALSTMLANVAEFYDEQVDDSMTRLVSLFEPILLVTMGAVVAVILLAMYLPIFQLAGSGT